MTTKRVTKQEKQQRHEWAMKKIDQGVGFSELASLVSDLQSLKRLFLTYIIRLRLFIGMTRLLSSAILNLSVQKRNKFVNLIRRESKAF